MSEQLFPRLKELVPDWQKISQLEDEITQKKEELAKLRLAQPQHEVQDYELKDVDGNPVMLSSLFGDKKDLILIHNMGQGCVYCTLWADGLNGFVGHLEDRAAFVLASPDEPSILKRFAEGRGWKYHLVSVHGSPFSHDMGYADDEGSVWPGFTTFRLGEDGKIRRISNAFFGPGDDFCAVWPMFGLLENGCGDWSPKYRY